MKKIVLLFMLLFTVTIYGQDFEIGKKIFTENCSSCHKMEQKLVGPSLQNVIGEQGRDWTREWINNSQKLIDSGDKHANDVYNEYNKMVMPAYSGIISDEDIESLLTYLEDYKVNKEDVIVETSKSTTITQSSNPPTLPLSLIIMVGVVILIFFITIFILIWIVKLLTSSILKEDSINNFLMIKLGTDSKKLKKEFDDYLNEHTQKQVKEVMSKFKKEFNDKFKEF